MSIIEELEKLCEAKLLKLWEPNYEAHQSCYRRLYVAPSVHEWLQYRRPPDPKLTQYTADVRHFLKTFVIGADFDDDEKLKNLDTNGRKPVDRGIWAIRVKRAPQTRILGSFPCSNVFVASHHSLRSTFNATGWETHKQQTIAFWNTLTAAAVDSQGNPTRSKLTRLTGIPRAVLVSNMRTIEQ